MTKQPTNRTAIRLIAGSADNSWIILPATWDELGSNRIHSTPARWLADLINRNSAGVRADVVSIPHQATDLMVTELVDWPSLVEWLTGWMAAE